MRRRRNHEWAGGRGRRERVRVYEAYEVKNKRQKLRCLLLRRKKNCFFIYEVITWGKEKKALLFSKSLGDSYFRTDYFSMYTGGGVEVMGWDGGRGVYMCTSVTRARAARNH